MTKLAACSAVAIALALAAVSAARSQGPDVQIVELVCTGDPELVRIQNLGDALQEFAGWQLQSDPVANEVFDLSPLFALPAGGSITIQSGPAASGAFIQEKWGRELVFRDGDATDYARIVDNSGAVVHQVNCGGAAPGPTPTPSPAPSPAPGVPNGGGPPPAAGDAPSAAMMVLIGGSMAAAGAVTFALPWLRLRPALWVGPVSPRGKTTTARLPARRRANGRREAPPAGGQAFSAARRLALVGLLAAAVALLLRRRRA